MLKIVNNKTEIIETDFWESEFNSRNLVYLSANAGALRLLLPQRFSQTYLSEILTGKKVVIEKSMQIIDPLYADIVFEDGSSNPFAVTFEQMKQADRTLEPGNTKLIVYAGSLDNRHEFACEIKIHTTIKKSNAKFDYIDHITVNTGHRRKSPRSEVAKEILPMLKTWIKDMLGGIARGINDQYLCKIGRHNAKMCEFLICRTDEMMAEQEIAKAVLCTHSREKAKAWRMAGGHGTPPEVPFLAVKLNNKAHVTAEETNWLGDFERCIAWAYIDYHADKNDE
ncbi:hypothetical protein ACWA5Z_06865 [Testudinibacter sp. P80/BLE/0925]